MTLTVHQRLAALERANEVRAYRSTLKTDLRVGRIHLAQALLSDDPELATMRLRDLLRATPGIGTRKADRALRACRFTPTTRLAHVTRRGRVSLLSWIAVHYRCVQLGWSANGAVSEWRAVA